MSTGSIGVAFENRGARRIARVTINHARKLNTFNRALMGELIARLEGLAQDAALLAVVLTGEGGKAFVGGADIDEMSELDPAAAEAFITLVHRSCDAVRALPMTTIARIDGYTF